MYGLHFVLYTSLEKKRNCCFEVGLCGKIQIKYSARSVYSQYIHSFIHYLINSKESIAFNTLMHKFKVVKKGQKN